MKTLLIICTLLVAGTGLLAQNSTVTVNTTGNRNKQVIVDGKSYAISNAAIKDSQAIMINDLAAGQHTLELVRANPNSRNTSTKTSFTLRDGYDLTLTISANGSISTAEKRIAGSRGNNRGQVTAAAFTKLYNQVKAKTSSTSRATSLENEWNTSNKQFTSKQVSQLIQLVSSETLRLKLAKLSYTRTSDPENFYQVTNLLSNTANKTALNAYIQSQQNTDDGVADVNTIQPLADAAFGTIYDEVVAEPTSGDRTYYLNNFFSRDFNHYTADQARRLIELVTTESDRLSLAKTAYRGITDRENYNMVYPLLNTTASRNDLAAYTRTYDASNPWASMSTADFDKLYQTVYYQNSPTTRYNTINKAFTTPGNYFTVAQARKLIPLVNDEANRLKLAKASYRILADRSNYQQFNDLFTSASVRNDFNAWVSNFEGTGLAVKTAMTDTDFNSLYRKVQLTFGIGAKYSTLTDIFNTETNYFTVAQTKRLIQLVSAESNRLELAKSSYNNITDPENFSQLYDVFSSQTSKNALMNYIASVASGN